jgi:pyruvate-ferredoxin/flavodoxin oxidoreductase
MAVHTTGLGAVRRIERQTSEVILEQAPPIGDAFAGGEGAALNIFDRLCRESSLEDAGALLAAVRGQTLAGLRVAGFLSARALTTARVQLRAAVRQRLPLLLHATTEAAADPESGGHRDYHALAESEALLLMARDVQHAVDLTLAARRVAELGLTPAIVAQDGAETAWAVQDLRMPERELIREVVEDSADRIVCRTAAQSLLFGRERRRVPRWFDPDRPSAHGLSLHGPDVDAAAVSRRAFFADHLPSLAGEAMSVVSDRTGRPIDFVTRFRTGDARQIIVAQGSAIDVAEAAASRLRERHGLHVGVLGIVWLRPFPEDDVREVLRGVERVTVLERIDDGTPLSKEIRSTVRGGDCPTVRSATFASLTAAQVASLYLDARLAETNRAVRLGASPPSVESEFPKREAWLQRVRRDYPDLERELVDEVEPFDARPPGSITVTLQLASATPPVERLESLAALLVDVAGAQLRSSTTTEGPGLWRARLTASREPLPEPGVDANVHLALVAELDPAGESNPAAELKRRGSLVVATRLHPSALWSAFPGSWREEIRRRELRLFAVQGGPPELIAAAAPLLQEDFAAAREVGAEEVAWSDLAEPPEMDRRQEPSLAVRRYDASTGGAHDSVARFWSEFAQPRLEGAGGPVEVDPHLALGVAPPCSATLNERLERRGELPTIDPERCTGCGLCWTACPDSAIAPVTASTQTLLDAAAEAVPAGAKLQEAAGKLRRVHRQLASRIDGLLAKSGARSLTPATVQEAFDWLLEKLDVGDDEAPSLRDRFATMRPAIELPLTVTDPFFHEMQRMKKGSGELLLLAVDARTCQGCGVCAAACPEEAIRVESRTQDRVEALHRAWKAWEVLPDTSGPTIARAASHEGVGTLPAVLMSRHSLFAVTGPDGAEPGSGERLALRQVLAVAEYEMQRRTAARIESLEQLGRRLRDALESGMARALPVEDLERLDEALVPPASGARNLTDVLARLEERGERIDLDLSGLRRLVVSSRDVERLRHDLAEGELGVGRARFGLVIAGRRLSEWAARFPTNPFGAPLVAELDGEGPDLAIGLARGLAEARVDEARAVRRAELLLEAPTDLPARLDALKGLDWGDLTPEESVLCPPVLVVLGADTCSGPELAGIGRLLDTDLRLLLVVLDEHDLTRARGGDPLMLALGHRTAFAVSTSLAHPDHLFEGVSGALSAARAALIHLHTPSPARHGFPTERTLERARLAVECRVHPLVRYDPAAEGLFGRRISLEGNPAVEQPWAANEDQKVLTAAHWAVGETRFAGAFASSDGSESVPIEQWSTLSPGERGARIPTVPGPNGRALAVGESLSGAALRRLERWGILQELAGVVTPFTEAVRGRLEQELRDQQRADVEKLRLEHARELDELRSNQLATQAARLRERLLQLAGYRVRRTDGPTRDGGSS